MEDAYRTNHQKIGGSMVGAVIVGVTWHESAAWIELSDGRTIVIEQTYCEGSLQIAEHTE